MGQKVNPIGLRLGINRNWESRWFPAKGRTADFIAEDNDGIYVLPSTGSGFSAAQPWGKGGGCNKEA